MICFPAFKNLEPTSPRVVMLFLSAKAMVRYVGEDNACFLRWKILSLAVV